MRQSYGQEKAWESIRKHSTLKWPTLFSICTGMAHVLHAQTLVGKWDLIRVYQIVRSSSEDNGPPTLKQNGCSKRLKTAAQIRLRQMEREVDVKIE